MKGCMHVEAGAGMRSVVHVCTGWGEKHACEARCISGTYAHPHPLECTIACKRAGACMRSWEGACKRVDSMAGSADTHAGAAGMLARCALAHGSWGQLNASDHSLVEGGGTAWSSMGAGEREGGTHAQQEE